MSIFGGKKNIFYVNGRTLLGLGENDLYQLGQDDTINECEPVEIAIPGRPQIMRFKNGVASDTIVVLTTKGLYGCGDGSSGQFGDGLGKHQTTMKELKFYRGLKVRDYYSEAGGVWVILSNHAIYRSGSNHYCTLGNGTNIAIFIPRALDKKFLYSEKEVVLDFKAYEHSLLLTNEGSVYTCGSGSAGKRGLGNTFEGKWFEEIKFFRQNKEKVVLVAVGCRHSLFVTSKNLVYSCGNSQFGQLGHNDNKSRHIPTVVKSLKDVRIKKVCCGWDFSMFLTVENCVYGCGENDNFETGDQTRRLIFPPTKIISDLQIIDVATTYFSTSFLTLNGDVYSIGANKKGETGVGHFQSPVRSLTKSKMKLEMRVKTVFEKGKPRKLTDSLILCGN